jgi:hypothetical protein
LSAVAIKLQIPLKSAIVVTITSYSKLEDVEELEESKTKLAKAPETP